MSVILDALRKSEHERQRSAVPGLAQVPVATPRTEMPRWALVLIGALGAAVLVMGGAWWQSARERAPAATPAQIERPLEVPALAAPAAAPAVVVRVDPPPAMPTAPPTAARQPSLADAVTTPRETPAAAPPFAPTSPTAMSTPPPVPQAADTTLPSAAALAAQGFALPPLRLELHAYAPQPADRFVFINGRKYTEGQRINEGPQVVTIAPNGAVLSHLGQRFMLSPE